jgi:membrane-anchored glycerophosphoryl diester phosphodiesterase (GDPDase)
MEITKKRIEEIKKNGYELNFETVFNHAFLNYKKIALYEGAILFAFLMIVVVFAGIIGVSVFGVSKINPKMFEELQLENLSGLYVVIYLITAVFFSAVFSPLSAGFIKIADDAEKGEKFQISAFFKYYKSPYFKELFVSTILISFITSGFSIALELAGLQIIGFIISMTISFFTVLTMPLIIFGDLKAMDAIQSSLQIVTKQPFVLVLLLFVGFIASLVGFIGCCIGIFFTLPFLYAMHYAIYCAIIGVDTKNELEQIGLDNE